MPDRKLRVFLCHASQDKPIVRELYQRLLAEGWIDPWLDEEKLLPGQNWDMEIEKAVEATEAVIVCLSNSSVTKEGYIQKELRFVLDIADEKPEETIFIIPLRLDDCPIPRRIRMRQYVDYFPFQDLDASFQKIKASLRKRYLVVKRISKGDKFLADGTKLEWIDKKEIRVGKGKISEVNYILRGKKKKR
ncbi:MAG TPA: toll/interleukin-1 receptor domain-containing protein [Anaerolineales bacterium]